MLWPFNFCGAIEMSQGKVIVLVIIILLVGYVFKRVYDSASYCLTGHGGLICKVASWFA